jgi:hypothetical protein
MSNAANQMRVPAGWQDSLTRSKAEIAAGQSVPLLPILDRLRAAAERLETAESTDANADANVDADVDAEKANTRR